jgi:AraC family transcriptional regulator, regulatory protein of adaptative response / methylated-DNA-[protein]-cysteine methyltransferase
MAVKASEAMRARALSEADPRWAAVLARDAGQDGKFLFAVRTTGVYCRPSCASRRARPENVVFYDTAEAAERAGFRPCKRCNPRRASPAEQRAAIVARACRFIETADELPQLATLARQAGLSAFHFHRLFKATTGLTPRAYALAQRARRVRRELRRGGSVTRAMFDAGFNSSGRFYASAGELLGMTPGQFRAGGVDNDIRYTLRQCSLGSLLVARSTRGICAIQLGSDPGELVRELRARFPQARFQDAEPQFERWVRDVVRLVDAPALGLKLPLDVRGTVFQQRVWEALRQIPAGATASYAEIARRIGAPRATRAVAQACAANTLAVAIPCHRVTRSDGTLAGYRWGAARKRQLLRREHADAAAGPSLRRLRTTRAAAAPAAR